MAQFTTPTEALLKQAAKARKKQAPGLKHTQALDQVAQEYGFHDYAAYLEHQDVELQRLRKASCASLQPASLGQFRAQMAKRGLDFSLFIPTKTGLKKSILDATAPVRLHFDNVGFHDYAKQGKGPADRIRKQAFFVTGGATTPTTVSLYRPETKKGDPRMWFSGLGQFAQPNDVIAIVFHDGAPYLINLSGLPASCSARPRVDHGGTSAQAVGLVKDEPALQRLGQVMELPGLSGQLVAAEGPSTVPYGRAPTPLARWSQGQLWGAAELVAGDTSGTGSKPAAAAAARQGLAGAPAMGSVLPAPDLAPVVSFLDRAAAKQDEVAHRLLGELRTIAAKGPLRAPTAGDTAVGMAVEHALKIDPNCHRGPDYGNQIEIKSARNREASRQNRQTLFAQVPDWGRADTTLKSSAAILERFGYQRGDDFKLYCTVSAQGPNSQGLSFAVSDDGELLQEVHEEHGVVAIWPARLLVKRLLQKHSETFWIKADSVIDGDGVESFMLKSAVHTKKPLASQLLQLIREGHVTMDHLIKRKPTGEVSEKGPLFKINPEGFKYLFPEPKEYSLTMH